MQENCAFFKNGVLYDVSPRNATVSLYEDRETAYKSSIIVSDGVKYDLTSSDSIKTIPAPHYADNGVPTTFELSYILKIYCGSCMDAVIIPDLINKVLELMQASPLLWRRRDYLQVIRNYYRLGMFEKGDSFEDTFRVTNPHLFSDSADDSHETEHLSTKQYFKKKWQKKHPYV